MLLFSVLLLSYMRKRSRTQRRFRPGKTYIWSIPMIQKCSQHWFGYIENLGRLRRQIYTKNMFKSSLAGEQYERKETRMQNEEQLFDSLPSIVEKLKKEIAKKVVGQNAVIEETLISVFSNGHCLFVGVP